MSRKHGSREQERRGDTDAARRTSPSPSLRVSPSPRPLLPAPRSGRSLPPLVAGRHDRALVARPLFPSESAATQGDGLPLVMLWLALVVIWLVGTIGRKRFTLRFGPVDCGRAGPGGLAVHRGRACRPLWQSATRFEHALGMGRTGHGVLSGAATDSRRPRGPRGRGRDDRPDGRDLRLRDLSIRDRAAGDAEAV